MIAGVVVLALIILAVGSLGSVGLYSSSGSNNEQIQEFIDQVQEGFQPDVAVQQVLDPWVPETGGIEPPEGRRFVAIEVTVQARSSGPGQVASPVGFKLTDSESFAYSAMATSPKTPALRDVGLNPGEKTSGWVVFEIDDLNPIASLTYNSLPVDLP